MTSQKTFKRRVRARAAKTGESYTAARAQVLRRATPTDSAAAEATASEVLTDEQLAAASPVADEQVVRNTGRNLRTWVEILDAWGARDRSHTEIARWLAEEHDVPGWYAQSITVTYERARGMRAIHQTSRGFSIGVSRTIAADAERATEAFTDPELRQRWLPDAPMRERTVRPGRSARFDWSDPSSRLVVTFDPKAGGRVTVAVTLEQLPGPEVIEERKAFWRDRMDALKALLEGE